MEKLFFTAILTFFLLISLVLASKVKVIYFYSSLCPASISLNPTKEVIKNFWKNYVEWIEFDFMKNREPFDEYLIFNVPVAIVECFNKSYRVERDEISTKLNETITKCFICDGFLNLKKECEIGANESKACGKCGISYRYCKKNCEFSNWSKCLNEKECYPNTSEKRSCSIGNCEGYQIRTCNKNCYWDEWSYCIKINPECRETIIILPKTKENYEIKFSKGILAILLIFVLLVIGLIFLSKI